MHAVCEFIFCHIPTEKTDSWTLIIASPYHFADRLNGNLSSKCFVAWVTVAQRSFTVFSSSNQTRCHRLISANKPALPEPPACCSVWTYGLPKSQTDTQVKATGNLNRPRHWWVKWENICGIAHTMENSSKWNKKQSSDSRNLRASIKLLTQEIL